MSRDIRLLAFTSLYPSASRPRHGVFVETRLLRLVAQGGVTVTVIAPVPWFPFSGERWGEYGRIEATPLSELRGGVEVRHPRYVVLPKIGLALQPAAMTRAGMHAIKQLKRPDFDVIEGHYLYPDGVAAAEIGRRMKLPVVLFARGSDVNVIAKMPAFREEILRAIDSAGAVVAVSGALKSSLVELGAPEEKIAVLRNGVDSSLFVIEDRCRVRREFGLGEGPVVASVGNLVEGKRHDLVIEAAARLPDARVLIVGRGPERRRLQELARRLRIQDRVHFLDEMSQDRLRRVYCAANVLALASEREGWPNVLLEAAACGTPVVAFDVGGVREIVAEEALGIVLRAPHAAEPLTDAIRRLTSSAIPQESVRAAALPFAWEPILQAQLNMYQRVIGR